MEVHNLIGEQPHFVQIFPPGQAGYLALGILIVVEADGQAAIGIVEVAPTDRAVARDVPKEGARSNLYPFAVDADPAASDGHQLDTLPALGEEKGGWMQSRALMIMRDGYMAGFMPGGG